VARPVLRDIVVDVERVDDLPLVEGRRASGWMGPGAQQLTDLLGESLDGPRRVREPLRIQDEAHQAFGVERRPTRITQEFQRARGCGEHHHRLHPARSKHRSLGGQEALEHPCLVGGDADGRRPGRAVHDPLPIVTHHRAQQHLGLDHVHRVGRRDHHVVFESLAAPVGDLDVGGDHVVVGQLPEEPLDDDSLTLVHRAAAGQLDQPRHLEAPSLIPCAPGCRRARPRPQRPPPPQRHRRTRRARRDRPSRHR